MMFEGILADILAALKYFIGTLFSRPEDIKANSMNAEPVPTVTPTPVIVPPKYLWDTKENVRHSVRVICDEEGLSVHQKNELCATVQCESGFNTKAINKNMNNGKVSSVDYGLCQWNNYWHGKEISPTDAINNPEKAVRLMCKYWLNGQAKQWVCYSRELYKPYL